MTGRPDPTEAPVAAPVTQPTPSAPRPGRLGGFGPPLALVAAWSLGLALWYGSWHPGPGRFWDERFSAANVESALTSGSLRPVHGNYPALSYLPETAVLAVLRELCRWTGFGPSILSEAGRLTPAAYLVCRGVQGLYGAAALVVTFLLGRRLFGAAAGWVGAVVLAATPWWVHAGGVFKPDLLLVLTVLLTVVWSLAAVAAPSRGRDALAGLGVGLATSAKLIGAAAAVPLAVGTWATVGFGRAARRLLLAALVAVAVFLLLDPYLGSYLRGLGLHLRLHHAAAAQQGETRLGTLLQVAVFFFSWTAHGRLLGAAALLGGVGLARGIVRRPERRAALGMFASFPLAWIAGDVALSAHYKENYLLPVLPFTSLLAGWTLVGGWRWAAARLPFLRRPAAATMGGALFFLALAPAPLLYVERSVVRPTHDAAVSYLVRQLARQPSASPRLVYAEPGRAVRPEWQGGARAAAVPFATVEVEGLQGLSTTTLERADAELFREEQLDEDGGTRRRLAETPRRWVRRFRPRLLRLRGPALVVLLHPWRSEGAPRRLALHPGDGATELAATLPELTPGATVSLVLHTPAGCEVPTVLLSGAAVLLYPVGGGGEAALFTSSRIEVVGAAGEVHLRRPAPAPGCDRVRLELQRWLPPESRPAASQPRRRRSERGAEPRP